MKYLLGTSLVILGVVIGLATAATGLVGAPSAPRAAPGSRVIAFDDPLPDVESKCDGSGHRVYVASRDGSNSNVVVLPDPTCPGYVAGREPPVVASGIG